MSDILLVDDEPHTLPLEVMTIPGLRLVDSAQSLQSFKRREVDGIVLFLVDYDLKNILSDDEDGAAFQPSDGLAVIESIRSSVGLDRTKARPLKGFAIVTHAAENLSLLPGPYRAHVAAREYNVDWIFQKPKPDNDERVSAFSANVRMLADEVKKFPRWDRNAVDAITRTVLNISDTGESKRLWEDVQRARPPRHELAKSGGGAALFRWLLQRALPYPGFLIEPAYVAARLGTTVDELERTGADSPIGKLLAECRYQGLLCDFFEQPRYWRGLLEGRLWSLTGGNAFDRAGIGERLGLAQVVRGNTQLTVALDDELLPKRVPVPADDCVRLTLDDWPLFADPPWASKTDVGRDAFLQSVAVPAEPYAK